MNSTVSACVICRYRLFVLALLFVLGLVMARVGHADTHALPDVQELIQKAGQLELQTDRSWRRLLHFHPLKSRPGRSASHVDDPRYFLSPKGGTDLAAELEASIQTLFGNSSVPIDDAHPRCRFVEREHWLREQLGLAEVPVPNGCSAYHDWRENLNAHSVTLVFPAAYLNSPSSMFGHTLLRLDPENIDEDSSWLSWSLNFAAETGADSASSAGYAIKGVTGAYPGKFHVIPYFQKLQEYGAIENRDIWEYQLDLDAEEVDRMVRHSWELRDIRFAYYFFRENCSFRLLELIDYARPELSLSDQFDFTAIPGDTVKAVVEAGLVDQVKYRPSAGSELQYRISEIDTDKRHWIEALLQEPERAQSPEFAGLDADIQARLVQTANQLLTYRSRKTEIDADMASRRFRMLQQLAQFKTSSSGQAEVPVPVRPDSSHDTTLVSFGVGEQGGARFTQASLRLSYHDLLDKSEGYPRGAAITLGELSIRADDDGDVSINAFDVVSLRSVSARLPIFDTISWGVDVGLRRDALLENNRLSFRVQGHVGKSRLIQTNTIVYGFLSPSANLFTGGDETLYLNMEANAGLLNYNRLGTSQVEVTATSLQRVAARFDVAVRHNLPLARNHALRFEFTRSQVDTSAMNQGLVSYRFFF